MKKFKFEKSSDSNVTKSIRFPEKLDTTICEIVDEANKGKKKKEFSFNGFVVSACQYAIDNMEK